MFVELNTRRLLLRPLSVADLHSVHQYAGDPENTKFMLHLPNRTLEETERFLKNVQSEWQKPQPSFYEFAVVLRGRQIGAVSLYLNEAETEGELGWILRRPFWANGYATEAASAVRDFAFTLPGLVRLVAHCDVRNGASRRVMEKLGMTLERADGQRQYPDTLETVAELTFLLNRNA